VQVRSDPSCVYLFDRYFVFLRISMQSVCQLCFAVYLKEIGSRPICFLMLQVAKHCRQCGNLLHAFRRRIRISL